MVGLLSLSDPDKGTIKGQNNAGILSLPTPVNACITEFGITFGITFAGWPLRNQRVFRGGIPPTLGTRKPDKAIPRWRNLSVLTLSWAARKVRSC